MCKWEMPAMTAVIYARYSTDSQSEESIEGQIRECTAYAEKNGFTVVKHYIDRAISAQTDNRPQFQQMIKDSERGIFDVIIAVSYTHLIIYAVALNFYCAPNHFVFGGTTGLSIVLATCFPALSVSTFMWITNAVLDVRCLLYTSDVYKRQHQDGTPQG